MADVVEKKQIDRSAILEMLHEFFLDNRVMNITYAASNDSVTSERTAVDDGYIMVCGPASDEGTPPIKVATIDIQMGWGSNLMVGKHYIRIHSSLLLRVEGAKAFSSNGVVSVEAYLGLEDPEAFDKTLGLLEDVATEYNKVIKRWNSVENSLFGAHLVWDGLTLNELKLRR